MGNKMKIIVITVKCIPDPEILQQIGTGGTGIDVENVCYKLDPFDLIALEEALLIKEEKGGEVVILSMGPMEAQKEIFSGLAMGADRGILVEYEGQIESAVFARLLKKVLEKENPDLVLMGKQSTDDEFGQTGQMLACILGWPQVCFASELTMEDNRAIVKRETDGYMETLEVGLPAVVTVGLTNHTPRYITLPGSRKAKKKPIETIYASDLKVAIKPYVKRLAVQISDESTEKCELFRNVDDFVDALRTAAPEIFQA